jgi:ATP-dependent exoDNAse (exonuclease V) alpha subunit
VTLAIYHLSIKIISRGKGKSAVAAAAYRAVETITNEYDGITHDYTRKGGVAHTEILLPENVPDEYHDRAVLWNAVEKTERFINAQLAREIEIALPVELTREQNISLARRFVKEQFVKAGMCADICLHDPDHETRNPHAHIMLTMRPIERGGKWGAKSRTENGRKIPTVDWNDRAKAEDWRKAWAAYCNTALRLNGHDAVVDWRSYERRGLEQIPTVHMGVSATRMERKGIATERGNMNREIEFTNKQIRQLRGRIDKLKDWVKNEIENPTPPTLADIISDVLHRDGSGSNYAKIRDLKEAAKVLNFLTENHISTLAELREKVGDFYGRQLAMGDKFKPLERRVKTLDEHIKHAENFKAYRGYKTKYDKLYAEYQSAQKAGGLFTKSKAQKALAVANTHYETNRAELTLYKAAERYLKDALQSRYDPKKKPAACQVERGTRRQNR